MNPVNTAPRGPSVLPALKPSSPISIISSRLRERAAAVPPLDLGRVAPAAPVPTVELSASKLLTKK